MAASKTLVDHLSTLQRGANSGLSPLLIEKSQASFLLNATVRGGFATNRPPFYRRLDIVWPSDEVEIAVQTGLFQGACYYSPDTGPQCLIASISGRLFQFSATGDTITVTEITISGDPNPSATTQAWLWQAEQFVIVNDGLSLPIFYDGTVSRRSAGPAVLLATATATDPAATPVPIIGDTFDLTLTADYTGPFDVPILFHGEFYEVPSTASTFRVALTTLFQSGAAAYPDGTEIVTKPSVAGYLTVAASGTFVAKAAGTFANTFTLSTPFTGPIGSLVSITSNPTPGGQTITVVWRVTAISGNTISVVNNEALSGSAAAFNYPIGRIVQNTGSTAPNTVVTILDQILPVTAVGTVTTVEVESLYTGLDGQIVFVGDSQYSIAVGATTTTPPSLNPLTVRNLSDAAGTVINFGTGLPLFSVPELPPGRMGAYGMGQNWECLVDGKSFIVSDISRGPSGTPAYDYRDAVLKTTELTFNGGSFAIPSAGVIITSMTFTAKMDESLGQGPLQIGTQTAMFSVDAPFDFSNPPPLNTPILPEILKGLGPLAQNSTILVNSDTFFRTPDGLATFIQARRDFTSWGNTGISDEVNERVLDLDTQSLLPYGSSIVFDNRFITTCSPQPSSNGVIHAGLIIINLDPVSSLSGKAESVYDGLWTGLNALQLITGLFDGTSRAFAFGYNTSTLKIELYEILPTKTASQFDNGYIPITWGFETAALFNRDVKPNEQLIRLQDGEFSVDNVVGNVHFKVWYRFDQGCWTPWHEFDVCNSGTSPQTYARLGLGAPSANDCNSVADVPSREGYTMQVKFQITGRCRFLRGRFKAVEIPSPEFKEPSCGTVTCKLQTCVAVPADLETYSLQSNVQFNGVPITVVVSCPSGYICAPGYYPVTITYPPGTFVIPNPPGNDPDSPPDGEFVFRVQGCQSEITGTDIATVLAELAAQQAACDAADDEPPDLPPPAAGPVITLNDLV